MKKNFRSTLKKLRSKAGESISETLISLLVASLALVMLAGAISSASAMITKSKDKLGDYYRENEKLAAISPSASPLPSSTVLSIENKDAAISKQDVEVLYMENKEFGNKTVAAYVYKKEA